MRGRCQGCGALEHRGRRIQMEGHRHRRLHAAQFGMLHRFLKNADVGLTERGLELREDFLRLGTICAKEPLERIERELLDRHDSEGAGPLPGAVPTHAVGHEKEMCALLANLQLRFRQARLKDAHRFREFGD